MDELQARAVRLAQEVKETGKTRTIPAINPAERRMVHMALQDDTEIRSRSVGEGLFKKVLIYLPGKGRRRSPRKKKSGENSPE
jgi:spoIIIJ-associated protein